MHIFLFYFIVDFTKTSISRNSKHKIKLKEMKYDIEILCLWYCKPAKTEETLKKIRFTQLSILTEV